MSARRSRRATPRALLAALALLGAASTLSACSGDDADAPSSSASASGSPSARPTPAPAPPKAPARGACYSLAYDAAIAPTSAEPAVACTAAHTTETVAVGTVDAVVDGHLLAIDSKAVQDGVGASCRAALGRYLGGDATALRLSMVRPVWFTPTVEQSDAGADWYRCDAVVLARNSRLAPQEGSLRGALKGRTPDRLAMCGTAAPDARDFQRVPCAAKHSWRAIDVVAFKAGRYPGESTVRAAGRGRCENAAADRAEDPLTFEWGYEWPTKEQWDAGQTFGRCWTRD